MRAYIGLGYRESCWDRFRENFMLTLPRLYLLEFELLVRKYPVNFQSVKNLTCHPSMSVWRVICWWIVNVFEAEWFFIFSNYELFEFALVCPGIIRDEQHCSLFFPLWHLSSLNYEVSGTFVEKRCFINIFIIIRILSLRLLYSHHIFLERVSYLISFFKIMKSLVVWRNSKFHHFTATCRAFKWWIGPPIDTL